jgi:hypothetical protein
MCNMNLNVNTRIAAYAGDEDGDDVTCLECAKSVTRRDGTVGRDDYDPHAEDPSDWSYGKTTEEILREMDEWAYHTRGF